MKKCLAVICGMFMMSVAAPAKQYKIVSHDKERTIVLEGVVNGRMFKKFQVVTEMMKKNSKPITLIINSPGGSVLAMQFMLNVMQRARSRGVKFVCVVEHMAASAAFHIFTECDRRYALPYSVHLWHPVRVNVGGMFGTALTPQAAERLAEELKRVELWLLELMRDKLPISDELFYKHYHNETLHNASELVDMMPGWMRIVDDIRERKKDD